jgi:hypothetical protein
MFYLMKIYTNIIGSKEIYSSLHIGTEPAPGNQFQEISSREQVPGKGVPGKPF